MGLGGKESGRGGREGEGSQRTDTASSARVEDAASPALDPRATLCPLPSRTAPPRLRLLAVERDIGPSSTSSHRQWCVQNANPPLV